MVDRINELNVMVSQACESIYRKSYDNKLTDEEYEYYISSILEFITSGMLKTAGSKLREKLNSVENSTV